MRLCTPKRNHSKHNPKFNTHNRYHSPPLHL
jgi:hypothetical protein